MLKNFGDFSRKVEGHLGANRLRDVLEVRFVASRKHHFGQSGPMGGQHLLLDATDGKDLSLQT